MQYMKLRPPARCSPLPLNCSPFNHYSPPRYMYSVVHNWHTRHAAPAAIIQHGCLTRLFFSHGNFCQKKFLAYKSIRVITGHKPQANLLYNVTLQSTLSAGPSGILHRSADTHNGTGDQNHRIPHNASPDVPSVIASCRRSHEARGDRHTGRMVLPSTSRKLVPMRSTQNFQANSLQFNIGLFICYCSYKSIAYR